jgi:hypothetical protein
MLIPLGIENVAPANYTIYYNWIAISILCIVSMLASQRDARFFALIIPFVAAFELYAGWLNTGAYQANTYQIIIFSAFMGGCIYFQDTLHERFGIAGPGSKLLKLVFFFIILQSIVGLVNVSSIFPQGYTVGNTAQTPTQYQNIALNTEISGINSAGGLFAAIVDILSILTQMGVSILKLLLSVIISIVGFSFVLNQVYPWIAQAQNGLAFLVILQAVIWFMYLVFVTQLFWKPTPDPWGIG